jgi:hypothetical protein
LNDRRFDSDYRSYDRILATFDSPAYLQRQTSPPSIVQAERFWTPNLMQLLASRDYPVIDSQTMGEFIGRERLFRATDGAFLLHMSSEGKLEAEERIIWLTVRDAISWLNEAPDEFGSFWECAMDAPLEQKQIQHMGPS